MVKAVSIAEQSARASRLTGASMSEWAHDRMTGALGRSLDLNELRGVVGACVAVIWPAEPLTVSMHDAKVFAQEHHQWLIAEVALEWRARQRDESMLGDAVRRACLPVVHLEPHDVVRIVKTLRDEWGFDDEVAVASLVHASVTPGHAPNAVRDVVAAADSEPGFVFAVLDEIARREELASRSAHNRSHGVRSFSDDQIGTVLRRAAAELGEPLTSAKYDAWRANEQSQGRWAPAQRTLTLRFGSWSQACHASGVRCRRGHPGGYRKKWPAPRVLEAVIAYLSETGNTSVNGYRRWAQEGSARPSDGTIRARFGSWTQAVTAAEAAIERLADADLSARCG